MPTQTADLLFLGFSLVDIQPWYVIGFYLYHDENIRTIVEKLF